MNTLNYATRTAVCGLGAVLISTFMSWSVVESTAEAPFAATSLPAARIAHNPQHPSHTLLGKAGPAVLVD